MPAFDDAATLERLKGGLAINHISPNFPIAMQMRLVGGITQRTFRRKLDNPGRRLTPAQRADVYTLWLREQRPKSPHIEEITEIYCRDLRELGLSVEHVLECWNSCSRDQAEALNPEQFPEKNQVIDNIIEMSDRIARCFSTIEREANQKDEKGKNKTKKNNKKKSQASAATTPQALPSTTLKLDPATLPTVASAASGTANLQPCPASHLSVKLVQNSFASQGVVNAAKPQDQNRHKENARLPSNSQGPMPTKDNAESVPKIHPMFQFKVPRNPSPTLPARTINLNSVLSTLKPLPAVHDLTRKQQHNTNTSLTQLQDNLEYRSSASFVTEDDSEDEMGAVSGGYVCKRCNVPECVPLVMTQTSDSKPSPDYVCHACGAKAEHYITSCPKRDPGYYLKQKKAHLVADGKGSGVPNLNPTQLVSRPWTETGFDPQEASRPARAEQTGKKASGHVRKRSEGEIPDERAKRPKQELPGHNKALAGDKSLPVTPIKVENVHKRSAKEGRVSPWDDAGFSTDDKSPSLPDYSDPADMDPFHPPRSTPQDRSAEWVAQAEADIFLTGLAGSPGDPNPTECAGTAMNGFVGDPSPSVSPKPVIDARLQEILDKLSDERIREPPRRLTALDLWNNQPQPEPGNGSQTDTTD